MPSSHSAGVVALASALWFVVGPTSPVFAVAVVFAAIVMYDAGGIRRHAGEHAVLLNPDRHGVLAAIRIGRGRTARRRAAQRYPRARTGEIIVGGLIGLVIGIAFGRWW